MTQPNQAAVSIPIENAILAKLGREPIDITITLTLQAVGRDGALHLKASTSKPRAKRRRSDRPKQDASRSS